MTENLEVAQATNMRHVTLSTTHTDEEVDFTQMVVTLPSGGIVIVGVGTSLADGSALVQIDTEPGTGNLRVFINDDDDPLLDQDPETGEYAGVPR